jgi:hypothetical protein
MFGAPKLPDFSDLYRKLRSLPERQHGEDELVVRPRPVLAHSMGAAQMITDMMWRFGRRGGGAVRAAGTSSRSQSCT